MKDNKYACPAVTRKELLKDVARRCEEYPKAIQQSQETEVEAKMEGAKATAKCKVDSEELKGGCCRRSVRKLMLAERKSLEI